jgi:hypothetical protein
MRSQYRDARRLAWPGWGAAILLLTGCEMPLALRPRGPAAAEIANIWWILFWTATPVAARSRPPPRPSGRRGTTGFVIIGGGIIPTIILVAATFLTLSGLRSSTGRPRASTHDRGARPHVLVGDRVPRPRGHDGQRGPRAGRPERPRRAGVGRRHPLLLGAAAARQARDDPRQDERPLHRGGRAGRLLRQVRGVLRPQHANMEFQSSPSRRRSSRPGSRRRRPTRRAHRRARRARARGVRRVAVRALPHDPGRVDRGGRGRARPDPPGESRRTLAARTLTNVRGNLGGWILDPQGIKPGSRMPASTSSPRTSSRSSSTWRSCGEPRPQSGVLVMIGSWPSLVGRPRSTSAGPAIPSPRPSRACPATRRPGAWRWRGWAARPATPSRACGRPAAGWPRRSNDLRRPALHRRRLPNTPENAVRFILDPQGVSPGSAMPDLRVVEAEARDMVAYLYTLGGR